MGTSGKTKKSAASLAFNTEMNFEYGVASELVPGVRRIVANNPSNFTFKGTNTYIIGQGEVALVDPGPEDTAHLQAILDEVRGERITHILITHTHRDHTDGLDALKTETGAPVFAYGHTDHPRGARTTSLSGKSFVDMDFRPDEIVRDGDEIHGRGWTLDVLHTPGHAPDHLCFGIRGERVLLSGDHVMGWNTTVVAPPEGSMGDYLASLEKLLVRNDQCFLPGHGARIENPQRAVKAYLMHRKMRESAIYTSLEKGDRFIPQIVARIYTQIDPSLEPAAALSVLAHLELLVARGLVECEELPPAIHSTFSIPPVAPSP